MKSLKWVIARKQVLASFASEKTALKASQTLAARGIECTVEPRDVIGFEKPLGAHRSFELRVRVTDLKRAAQTLDRKAPRNGGPRVCPQCMSANYFVPFWFFDVGILAKGDAGAVSRLRECRDCGYSWRECRGLG